MSKVVNISENVTSKLEILSKKFNVGMDYLTPIYMKYATAGSTEQKALVLTNGDIEAEFGNLASGAPTMYAYVLNDFGIVDIFEMMRQKSKRLYDDPETQQKAIDDGLVSFDGTPLDYRLKVFGKDNELYGQPLTGTSYQRTIVAILSKDEAFNTVELVELGADSDFAKELPTVEAYKFYAFRANQNPKFPFKVRLSKGTKFRVITPTVTIAEIASKIPTTEIADIETEYNANFAGKKRTNYLTAIRGSVTWMGLDVIGGNRTFILVDESIENQLRCKLPETIPVVFTRGDDMIAFSRLFPGRDGKIGAQIRSYLVVA
jgi:hypothetical protein